MRAAYNLSRYNDKSRVRSSTPPDHLAASDSWPGGDSDTILSMRTTRL